MLRSPRAAITRTWAVLMIVTVGSWALGSHQSLGADNAMAGVAVLVLAFVKVRLIGRHFMELREAPAYARRTLDAYCMSALTALTVMYLAM